MAPHTMFFSGSYFVLLSRVDQWHLRNHHHFFHRTDSGKKLRMLPFEYPCSSPRIAVLFEGTSPNDCVRELTQAQDILIIVGQESLSLFDKRGTMKKW